jgi:hypothetical protein
MIGWLLFKKKLGQKNHIFTNFRGGARRVRPPPLDPPLISIEYILFGCNEIGEELNILLFKSEQKFI